jgi:hypothetical protein
MLNNQIDTSEVRKRMNLLWEQKGKKELGLTQVKAAKILNISQAAFSFYLSGKNSSQKHKKMSVNTDFIRQFAAMLRISPSEIDPSLQDLDKVMSGLNSKSTPVLFSLSGMFYKGNFIRVNFPLVPTSTFAVEVDIDNYNGLIKGQYLLCDKKQRVHEDDLVFMRLNKKSYYGWLKFDGKEWFVIYYCNNQFNTQAVKKGKLFFVSGIHNPKRDGLLYDLKDKADDPIKQTIPI